MEQPQIDIDEKFMMDNGFQCKPLGEYPDSLQALTLSMISVDEEKKDDRTMEAAERD
jgi:hypothetical protein